MAIKSLKSSSIRNNVFYRSMLAGNEHFGKVNYWLATLGGASNDFGEGVTTDSAGSIYTGGYTNSSGAGSSDFSIVKYNTNGIVQWQRTLGGVNDDRGFSVKTDSSLNVLIVGQTSSGIPSVILAKYNTSGTLQWQRLLSDANFQSAKAVSTDSSGDVYLAGWATPPSNIPNFLVAKYNTSGTLQWQRTLGGADNDQANGISLDSSGNSYLAGEVSSGAVGSKDLGLAKYNTSGTIQWQRVLQGGGSDFGASVAVNSSGDSFVTGRSTSSGFGDFDLLLAKYNTSGTIQWQRVLGGAAGEFPWSVALDSLGNAYVSGQTSSSGPGSASIFMAKYNTSGTIQWQRTLGGAGFDMSSSITLNPNDEIVITGNTTTTGVAGNDLFLAKLPNDGSLTGTYILDGVNITYASSSLTTGTSAYTSATSSLTDSAGALTSSTSTLTDASSSLTSHLTLIP